MIGVELQCVALQCILPVVKDRHLATPSKNDYHTPLYLSKIFIFKFDLFSTVSYNKGVVDWKGRAALQNDVVYFDYWKGVENLADEAYVWDLDKTYLDTNLESLRSLFRTFTEKPGQKRNVPGTGTLVRCLQDSWNQRFSEEDLPLYFITASPPQMEPKIIAKMRLDGLKPRGLYCKDNLKNLLPKRLWKLNKQVGYKVQALMQLRQKLAEDVRMMMWGDDSESDVIIYNIFSDLCARRRSEEELRSLFKAFFVSEKQIRTIFTLQKEIPKQDPVEKIYIHLADDTDAEYYMKFGRRVLPIFNSFQAIVDLYQDQRVQIEHVFKVTDSLIKKYSYSTDQIEKSFDELIRRQVLAEHSVNELLPELKSRFLVPEDYVPSVPPVAAVEVEDDGGVSMEIESSYEPWVPDYIDYLRSDR